MAKMQQKIVTLDSFTSKDGIYSLKVLNKLILLFYFRFF